jgi:hypothetical protein
MSNKSVYNWGRKNELDTIILIINMLEKLDAKWCAIDTIAVNVWTPTIAFSNEFRFVVGKEYINQVIDNLNKSEIMTQKGYNCIHVLISPHLSIIMDITPAFQAFPQNALIAEVYGVIMRIASFEDTIKTKLYMVKNPPSNLTSKKIFNLFDISRLIENHPQLKDIFNNIESYL